MAPVFREVELTWGDKTYKCTPTFRLIQQIEQRFSIAALSARIAAQEPPMSHLAEIISILLRHGGCRDASPEDVYASLISAGTNPEQFAALVSAAISAFLPLTATEEKGNGHAPIPFPEAVSVLETVNPV